MLWENAKKVADTLLPGRTHLQPTGHCGSQGVALVSCDNNAVVVISNRDDLETMIAACQIALAQLQLIEGQHAF